jgi:DNA polymerase III sliding clamp (beta) subunit (PCNA family)
VNNDQKKVVINKTDLTEAITFICKSGGSKQLNHRNPVVYTFNNNTFKVSYDSTNRHIEEEIPLTDSDEDIDLQIGFNPFNVSDLLSSINGKQLTMSFDKPLSPSLVQSENEKEKYLVLPVRLKEAV